jgi:hypothetical protein
MSKIASLFVTMPIAILIAFSSSLSADVLEDKLNSMITTMNDLVDGTKEKSSYTKYNQKTNLVDIDTVKNKKKFKRYGSSKIQKPKKIKKIKTKQKIINRNMKVKEVFQELTPVQKQPAQKQPIMKQQVSKMLKPKTHDEKNIVFHKKSNSNFTYGIDMIYSDFAFDYLYGNVSDATSNNHSDDFGLENRAFYIRPNLRYIYAQKHIFDLSIEGISQKQNITLKRKLIIDNKTYDKDTSVNTKYNFVKFITKYRYAKESIRAGIDINYFLFDFAIKDNGDMSNKNIKKRFLFPSFGVGYYTEFESFNKMRISYDLSFLYLADIIKYHKFDIKATYPLSSFEDTDFKFGLALDNFKTNDNKSDTFSGNFKQKSVYFGISKKF